MGCFDIQTAPPSTNRPSLAYQSKKLNLLIYKTYIYPYYFVMVLGSDAALVNFIKTHHIIHFINDEGLGTLVVLALAKYIP